MTSDQFKPSASEQAERDAGRVKDAAEREAQSAKEKLQEGVATARTGASNLAAQAGERAKQQAYEGAETGKAFGASNADDFAAAIRKASDELGERDQSMAAGLLRQAAQGLESASREIKGRNVDEIMRAVSGFARRQPGAFLLGATLAGVALGRFARASSEHERPDESRVSAGGPPYGAYPKSPAAGSGMSPAAGGGASSTFTSSASSSVGGTTGPSSFTSAPATTSRPASPGDTSRKGD
ncbi:hypothetical protein [Consotaella aegiceratis]|uniref:hypothetical protein n=1 Tax=Consotaella aegiceratis TaxID=3097961 RepID=UPI002F3F069D